MSASAATLERTGGDGTLRWRAATSRDIAACIDIRGRTRENAVSAARLATLGITEVSWASEVEGGAMCGHVVEQDGRIVGFCFGSLESGEIVVLAVLPGSEARGLGRQLLRGTMTSLRAAGHRRFFLGCSRDERHRSYGFYRHLGWSPTGTVDAHGDEVLDFDDDRRPS